MNTKINYFEILMSVLRNFPSLVLDSREITVPANSTVTKKRTYNTATGEFSVQVGITNKVVNGKKYKVITFITDL